MRDSRCAVLVGALVLCGAAAVQAAPHGMGTVTLIDGTAMRCAVLFEHPHAPRLIVRSPEHRTVQSLDLDQAPAVTANGHTTGQDVSTRHHATR